MSLDRRSFLSTTLAAAAAALSGSLPSALAKIPPAGTQAPGVYRFKVGSLEVTALSDGWLPIELKVYADAPRPEAERLLESAFLATDKVPTAVNAYLVNAGDRLVLIDTGTANAMGATLGRLAANLTAAGVDPAAVDAVLLTHMHPDHAAGLLTQGGTAAFPNAELVVAEAEYGFWTDDGMLARAGAEAKPFFDLARAAVKPYSGRLRRIAPGSEVAPGIVSVAAPGHTPGHTMYRVASGDAALLVWGDIVHTAALQFARPDWSVSFDVDQAMARETRKRVFDQASADRVLVAGMHLNFPGLGQIAREGQVYRFVPAFWSPDL